MDDATFGNPFSYSHAHPGLRHSGVARLQHSDESDNGIAFTLKIALQWEKCRLCFSVWSIFWKSSPVKSTRVRCHKGVWLVFKWWIIFTSEGQRVSKRNPLMFHCEGFCFSVPRVEPKERFVYRIPVTSGAMPRLKRQQIEVMLIKYYRYKW